MPRHFIIGTAGHIDHGKSTLVQTLTGTNPDRLPEEKERGVTIELGFAHFNISTPAGNDTFELGVVDVPGHADFINNMVAGVGAIDLAVFIVAADDSWMPQSEEHLQILSYLGIKNFVVALTKADLCEDIEFVQEMLADDLKGTALENAPIIPVSAPTGLGMDQLKESLRDILWKAEQPRDFGQPRLAVDRAFSPKGVGTVVTGTLTGGSISTGDKLTTYPSGLSTNIRSIQNHSSSVSEAKPGMRTALNLPDLPLSAKGKKGISRGHLLVGGNPGAASTEIDVLVTRAARPIPGQKGTQRPIKNSSKVYVHHGSGRSQARLLHSKEGRHIQPGETAIAQLRFQHSVHTLIGEHLVLRELSGEATLGGAIVLDAHPDRRHFRNEDRQDFLTERATDPHDLSLLLTTHLKRDRFLSLETLSASLPFAASEIKTALKKLTKANEIAAIGKDHFALSSFWKDLSKKAAAIVKGYHQSHPDLSGMGTDLLEKELGSSTCFQAVLDWLGENNFRVAENLVCHNDHALELPPELEAPAAEILKTLGDAGLQPPLPGDLQPTANHEQAYRFLSRTKQIIPLDPKVTLSKAAYENAITLVRSHLEKVGQATASEIRQEIGTSRKVLMPLLERFDRDKITRRDGDFRTLM